MRGKTVAEEKQYIYVTLMHAKHVIPCNFVYTYKVGRGKKSGFLRVKNGSEIRAG